MNQLKRWLPLAGVFVLAVSTLARYYGHPEAAAALEGAASAVGAQAPPAAAEVAAAAAALIGASIKLFNILRDMLREP